MKWQEKLRDGERAELERAKAAKESSNDVYKATVRKLKSRCEARLRRVKDE
jgi:hypothetical protein